MYELCIAARFGLHCGQTFEQTVLDSLFDGRSATWVVMIGNDVISCRPNRAVIFSYKVDG